MLNSALSSYVRMSFFLYSRPGNNMILVTTAVGHLAGLYF